MGIFGSKTAGAPSLLDYVGNFLFAHELPSYTNDKFAERAAKQAQMQQNAGITSYALKDAFGSDFGGGLPEYRGSTALTDKYGSREGSAPAGTTAGGVAAPALGGIPTTGGSTPRTNGTAYTGDDGNLFYNEDGSPRAIQDLQNDRRYIGLKMAAQNNPTLANTLKAQEDAAEARREKWEFHNDRYMNVNSKDPTKGEKLVGTGYDNATGQYTSVDANGNRVAHLADGYLGNRQATQRSDNTTALEKSEGEKKLNLSYDPRIAAATDTAKIDPAIELRRRQFQQDMGIGAQAAGAKAGAEAAAKAPWEVREIQGADGPVTGTMAQLAGPNGQLARGGLVNGRSDSTLNAIRTATEADNSEIRSLAKTNDIIQDNLDMLGKGGLDLGIGQNLLHKGQLALGIPDKQAANYNSFMGNMNLMRDQTLALQKGTQTEGDAERSMQQLMTAYAQNNERAVAQRLAEIKSLNEKAIAERQAAANQRNRGYGVSAAPSARPSFTADQLAAERARRNGGR